MHSKEEIEKAIVSRERNLYGLGEKLILYDLTNSYFEGLLEGSKIGKRGRSKEKRNDSPLLTVGLIIDEEGFVKSSKVFPGNVSEPSTLNEILEDFLINREKSICLSGINPTVVMDAGIVSEKNLDLIKSKGLEYICVDRRRVLEVPSGKEEEVVVNESKTSVVKAIKLETSEEVYLYCQSSGKAKKEASIKNRLQLKFEEELRNLKNNLCKKGCMKSYPKVLERIGKIKERYSSVSQFYEIKVKEVDGISKDILWEIKSPAKLEVRFSGRYKLRTSRRDLSEKELWKIYNLLTMVEESFRSLKHKLSLRPVYHRLDKRIEGHIFLTILAYHLLCVIQRSLRESGINNSWLSIRRKLSTMVMVTTTMFTEGGKTIYLRQSSEPEPIHMEIFNALGISLKPTKKVIRIN